VFADCRGTRRCTPRREAERRTEDLARDLAARRHATNSTMKSANTTPIPTPQMQRHVQSCRRPLVVLDETKREALTKKTRLTRATVYGDAGLCERSVAWAGRAWMERLSAVASTADQCLYAAGTVSGRGHYQAGMFGG
jgi:hypothetical protein